MEPLNVSQSQTPESLEKIRNCLQTLSSNMQSMSTEVRSISSRLERVEERQEEESEASNPVSAGPARSASTDPSFPTPLESRVSSALSWAETMEQEETSNPEVSMEVGEAAGEEPSTGGIKLSTLADKARRTPPKLAGEPVAEPPDGRTMVPKRSSNAHQLPGAFGSNSGNSNLCQEEGECPHSLEDGQHVCPDLHQQDGWYGLSRSQSAHQRTLVLVPYQECHTSSLSPPRNSQRENGRGIKDQERSIRLDALPGYLREHSSTDWSLRNGPVCVEAEKTASDLRELATRPRGSGDRCVLNELERTESLCQPAGEHDLPGLGSSQATGGNHCFGRSGVEN